MKHRLFNLAAATSLLLCLACLFMWVRGGFVTDTVQKQQVGAYILIWSGHGEIRLRRDTETPPQPNALESRPWGWGPLPVPATGVSRWRWTCPGYKARLTSTAQGAASARQVVLPYWTPTLISAIFPALWFWQRRKEKRLNRRGFEVLPAPAAKTEP